MNNINFSFDIKAITAFLLKKLPLVLWILLGLVIAAEAFVIKGSVDKILNATDQSEFAGAQLVRLNFDGYERIEKRLNENLQYLPPEPDTADPFGQRP